MFSYETENGYTIGLDELGNLTLVKPNGSVAIEIHSSVFDEIVIGFWWLKNDRKSYMQRNKETNRGQ